MKCNHFSKRLSQTATVTACIIISGVLVFTCSGCDQSKEPNDTAMTTSTLQTTVANMTTESTMGEIPEETAEQTTKSAVEPTKPTATGKPTNAAPATPSTPTPLSDAQQLQIRQDYYDTQRTKYPDDSTIQQMALADVTIRKHIATYGDSVVLFIDCPGFAHDNAFGTVEYEGLSFHFTDGSRPLVYRGGEFKTYQKAYEDGWLTRDNLYDLSLHFPVIK